MINDTFVYAADWTSRAAPWFSLVPSCRVRAVVAVITVARLTDNSAQSPGQ